MAIGQDELTRPLGMEPETRQTRRWSASIGPLLTGALTLVAGGLLAWTALIRDPDGGEPFAIVRVDRTSPPVMLGESSSRAQPGRLPSEQGTPDIHDQATAGELEEQSGVRVVRSGGGEVPGSVVIKVPTPAAAIKLAAAPDKRLVEKSRHGMLPKTASDGARPAEIYARPLAADSPKGLPRVALLVGGLGISQAATADAIAKLPPAVTLAFAPYGSDLERQVARAREDGHEVMLQVPMEPFDYPDNDPGPHTLTAAAPPADNLDKLHWTMSRFPGFTGLVNYMGAKFTSNEAALTPVLKDVAERGLIFVDDGSSGRSLVPTLSPAFRLPAARADGTIDATPKAVAIDAELAKLEAAAKDKGLAIGVASALPVSVDRIAQWSKTLTAKGLVLVPVSAAVARPGRD